MNVHFVVYAEPSDITLNCRFDLDEVETLDPDTQVGIFVDDQLILEIDLEEFFELAQYEDDDFYIGLDYVQHVWTVFDGFAAGISEYIDENSKETRERLVKQHFNIPENLERFLDFEEMWESDTRFNYAETDKYIYREATS